MTATVAIVDDGSGNLRSAAKAFERSVRALRADAEVAVTADPVELDFPVSADRPASAYTIYDSFRLTQAELATNRRTRR